METVDSDVIIVGEQEYANVFHISSQFHLSPQRIRIIAKIANLPVVICNNTSHKGRTVYYYLLEHFRNIPLATDEKSIKIDDEVFVTVKYLVELLALRNDRKLRKKLSKGEISYVLRRSSKTGLPIRYFSLSEIREKIPSYKRRLQRLEEMPRFLELAEKYQQDFRIYFSRMAEFLVFLTLLIYRVKCRFWPTDAELKKSLARYQYQDKTIKEMLRILKKRKLIVENPRLILTGKKKDGNYQTVEMPDYLVTRRGLGVIQKLNRVFPNISFLPEHHCPECGEKAVCLPEYVDINK